VSTTSGGQPSLRLTRTGAEWRETDVEMLRRAFQNQHCIKLAGMIELTLLDHLRRLVAATGFTEFTHDDLASELLMSDGVCRRTLEFLSNDRRLFDFVRAVSGCAPIRAFFGRVYRRCPNTHHHDSLHTDRSQHRIVGMSVNLSAAPHEGGTFQIRGVGMAPIAILHNTGPGDAIFFRIDPALEHRVTVVGSKPKTGYAGWFVAAAPQQTQASAPAP